MSLVADRGHDALVLELLRGLQRAPAPSQRAVAQRLGVSVGKAHYVLRALVDRGFVKLENYSNSRQRSEYLYVLTPRGLAEKARLTKRFLQRKVEEYERIQAEIAVLEREAGVSAGRGRFEA